MKGDLLTWQVYGLISVPKYTMKNGKDQMSFLELKDLRQESIFNYDFVENERYFNPSDNENILFLRDLVDVIAPFEEAEEIWMWKGAQIIEHHHGKVVFLKSPDQAMT